jgi:prepilin peptidase CpaA
VNLLRDAPLWAQLLLAALLLGAAVQDIVQRRISNWLCLGVLIAAVAAAAAIGPTLGLWQNGVCFLLLLGLGLPLFAADWLGGGDVKLFAALGLWANFAVILPLVACILIGGGVLAILSLAVRGGRAVRRTKGVPYGVAIAVGAAIMLLQPVLFRLDAQPTNPLDLTAARKAL